MCEPTTIALLSAAATAGGTIMQADAASDARKEQQRILAAAEEDNQKINRAGEEKVQDFAEKAFGAENREQRYEDAAGEREQSLAEALSSAKVDSDAATGNVSSDYLQARQASSTAADAEAAKRAKLLARTGASGLMYGKEGMMSGELTSDLAGLAGKTQRNNRYAQNAAGSVRGGSLAGGLLSGLGAAGLSYAAGGGSMMGGGSPGDGLSQGARRALGVY